ncbi:cell wall assembly regulator SMI1 [Stackebrandtia albiflava]|uniref:Cell wall assembly regulator SMI1 n=1 Tax=Stackebrandtia albiflava TaxID=406432 RepID=A0A562V0R5_9ACTN|nr:SMI1/KNR4 family protein [Stackebrandtia albiflava]TWJ11474.1 cell wall assembly regulator SMI1 [Stackebrandtia albiflava]
MNPGFPSPVADSWRRIDTWLATHAPESLAMLNPPASPEDVAAAEEAVGIAFPAQLRESLAVHDGISGWANLLPEADPVPTAHIARLWRRWTDFAEDVPPEAGREPWWHSLWIPWAESAGGDLGVVDMRPGAGQGRLGTAVHDDCGDFTGGWPDLATYLGAVARVLWEGGDVAGHRAYLTVDDRLWWSYGDRAVELNGQPLRPAPTGPAT